MVKRSSGLRKQVSRVVGHGRLGSALRLFKAAVEDGAELAATLPLHLYLGRERARGKRALVVYCLLPSHFQNVARIPELAISRGWVVAVLCGFARSTYQVKVPPDVRVEYGRTAKAVRLLRAEVFVSPEVTRAPIVPRGSRSVHFLVSLTGLEGVYADELFDGWDAIFCAGEYQLEDFRRLASRRNLSGKILIRGGYPKLDRELTQQQAVRPPTLDPTIVYAPTHPYRVNEALASLRGHSGIIINALLDAGYRVIFRPHPNSLIDSDRPLVESLKERFSGNPRFELDSSKDYRATYARCDLMVTDVSGTGFTFAFGSGRPAVFFAHNEAAERGMTGFHFDKRQEIGGVVRDEQSLLNRVAELLADLPSATRQIEALRDASVFHLGRSEAYFVEHLDQLADGAVAADWEVLK